MDESGGDVQSVAKRRSIPDDLMSSETTISSQKSRTSLTMTRASPSETARELQVHHKTVWRCIHEDLRYSSYVMRHFPVHDATNKEKPLRKMQKMLREIKHPEVPQMLWFFSDEKFFDQDQRVNRRNDRWFCQSGPRGCASRYAHKVSSHRHDSQRRLQQRRRHASALI